MILGDLVGIIQGKILLTDGEKVYSRNHTVEQLCSGDDDFCFEYEEVSSISIKDNVIRVDIETSDECYDYYKKKWR